MGKGDVMETNLDSNELKQLLAKADELIEQIDSDAITFMEEEHRLQFATYTHNLETIKSKVQGKIDKNGTSEIGSGATGMHQAIQDIVKAMEDLRNKLLNFPEDAFESPLEKGTR